MGDQAGRVEHPQLLSHRAHRDADRLRDGLRRRLADVLQALDHGTPGRRHGAQADPAAGRFDGGFEAFCFAVHGRIRWLSPNSCHRYRFPRAAR